MLFKGAKAVVGHSFAGCEVEALLSEIECAHVVTPDTYLLKLSVLGGAKVFSRRNNVNRAIPRDAFGSVFFVALSYSDGYSGGPNVIYVGNIQGGSDV